MASRSRLGEILLDRGLLTEPQLAAALEDQKRTREPLGEVLVRLGMIDRSELSTALGEQMRRWLAAGIAAGVMVTQPGIASARTATAPLTVSVEVLSTAVVAAHSAISTASGGAASVSLSCAGAPALRVTFDRASFEQAAAAAPSPYVQQSHYHMSLVPLSSADVPCANPSEPVSVKAPADTASGGPLTVEVAY